MLKARGDLDEALRIRTEEQLPVYEALGDKRELAVTKAKIADTFAAKSDVETALAMHLSRLPDGEATSDLSALIHIHFSCVRLRLERGDHHEDGLQAIAKDLAEAWAGASRLRRADAIGVLFGQVLTMAVFATRLSMCWNRQLPPSTSLAGATEPPNAARSSPR